MAIANRDSHSRNDKSTGVCPWGSIYQFQPIPIVSVQSWDNLVRKSDFEGCLQVKRSAQLLSNCKYIGYLLLEKENLKPHPPGQLNEVKIELTVNIGRMAKID
ncbi:MULTISPECIES: hypothetical protein [unclassified Synechocystis]|uniref:hypothetical protein n=1 Tax=unclassified Synechocystis TaxID=2640012 RepID=UPI00048D1580|nr:MULTISPECIES: hypothetical protein [unclassified Synechocystis]MCT0254693.1 hypothetical protein [Synechocystis sp. CS-94]